MKNCVAIIPARGGSKRLPRKNILEIAGENMISYPIINAIKCGLFDEVYVSTEDEEVKGIAAAYNASIIDRPSEFSSDEATVDEVCLHAIGYLKGIKVKVEQFCCIYPTAVLLSPETLLESKKMLVEDTDFVMGVSNFEFSPLNALTENTEGYLEHKWPDYISAKSQDLPSLVASNGTFYWANSLSFEKEKTLLGSHLKGYLVPTFETSDINTAEDLKRIKNILED